MKWERVSIFISSTFNDMHAERDYLVKDVFPELREWCEDRKIHLIDIDLRWGVTEEDSSSNHTVLACLNNIDDSRPFFLCFLGQRRGWVPQKGDISPATLAEYPDISKTIGRNSVTEMEIEHALLSPMRHIVNGNEKHEIPVEHALFYFRSPDYLTNLTNEQRRIFTNEAEKDVVLADNKLLKFKNKIKTGWKSTVDYDCCWDTNIISPELPESVNQGRLAAFSVDEEDLKDIVIAQLKEEILKEFPDKEKVEYTSDLERDMDQQTLFMELNSEGFISREGDFDDLNEYIVNEKDSLFVLTAPAGYGKSMLLANFVKKESKKHSGRFFYRFCGASDLCSEQYSLWKTILDEAHIECPESLEDLKDKIEVLLEKLAEDNTVLIIDAVNQLRIGLDMLEWLPKQLPENLKIILSLKEDEKDKELTDYIERLKEHISHSTVKPFEDKEEKKKLIRDYLKKYLKALDDKQIDLICCLAGSKKPLYLKILLSELRVFGSFDQLSKAIQRFGETPEEGFNAVLNRLENEVNSLMIDSKKITSLLFGLLANARNGLSEKELASCMQKELGIDEEKVIQAIRLFIRQVRPFMARRERRIDYFYESFKFAAKERYICNKIHYNKLLADHFKGQTDPEGVLSFKGENIRDFNELPYHLKESENTGCLKQILSTYLWIRNKTILSDIYNAIDDFNYIGVENEDNYHLKLIRDALVLSSHILKDHIGNLPTYLCGGLNNIENHRIKRFLIEIEKNTDYPWLKPRHQMITPGKSLNVTLSHQGRVMNVCISPDGEYIASGESDIVRIWEWKNRKEVRKIDGHVRSLCFSPDGKYIASGFWDKTVRVWDWKKQKEIKKLEGHTDNVNSICYSPDGKYIASGSSDQTVRVWDWESGLEIKILKRHTRDVRCVCFSPDGKYIASGGYDTVWVWDWEDEKAIQKLDSHISSIESICFSPNGKYIASGSEDNTIRIWDWKNAKEVKRLKDRFVNSICFSPDGKYIISGSSGVYDEAMPVKVWDWEKQKEVQRLDGHTYWVESVCVSLDGKYIVSGSNDHTVRVWDFKNKNTVQEQEGHTKPVTGVCLSPDGKYIASGSHDDTVRVWEFENIKELKILIGHRLLVECVCFFPDGKYIASGSSDNSVIVWDWEKQKVIQRLNGHIDVVLCVCLSPDGKYIVSGSHDKTIRIWDCEKLVEVQILNYNDSICSVCFSPDGKYLAVGTEDKTIRIWDWDNKKEIRKLREHLSPVISVCFSPDGKYIASGSQDNTIGIWDWRYGIEIQRLEGHTNFVNSVCFSNDGVYITSGSKDQTIRVWNWKKNIQILSLYTEEKITSCVFSNNNQQLVAGGSTGQVLLYDVKYLPDYMGIVLFIERWRDGATRWKCDYCGNSFDILKDKIGKIINCPHCNIKLKIDNITEYSLICIEEEMQRLEGHSNSVSSVLFSQNGKYIISGSWDRTIRIWNWKKQKEIFKLGEHTGCIYNLCFSPDRKHIAIGENGTLKIWDWGKQKEVNSLEDHALGVTCACFSPNGKYIASGGGYLDGEFTVRVWNWEKQQILSLKGHAMCVMCVCFSPDGKYLISGSHDKTIRIWDWEKQKEVRVLNGHTDSVLSLCFSPDGKYIISGSRDRTIRIWDWKKQNKAQILNGHTWVVNNVCMSPDGKYIASGSKDKTIRVWDWKNNREVVRLEGHMWDVDSVSFSPDGKYIVSGSKDRTIRIWEWKMKE